MTSVLLRLVRSSLGEPAVDELLRRSGVERTREYLDDVSNWVWQDEAIALLDAAAELTGDPEIAWRVGETTVRQHAGTAVATLLRSLGSPEAVFEQMASGVTKFSTVTEMEPLTVEPGRAVVRAAARPGFTRGLQMCKWARGLLSQPPALFGLPPAKVEESACQAKGDPHCLYEISWDAEAAARGADPEQLITSLEAQLSAMTDRLENMYATARDLIAIDDVDAALVRMTERAGTAVRAPTYLLAVRTRADGDLHVHHRGFDDEDPIEAAHRLLETGGPDDGHRIVAEVASASRSYGRLMAASPNSGFFSHERDLLEVYARYAAAVLETATALEDARARHAQASALLELSRSVAMTSSSDEVAARLADAVPAVVDCDRVVVFLWDEGEEALHFTAATNVPQSDSELIVGLRVRRSDSPKIARLIDQPSLADPAFFTADTDEALIGGLMRETGAAALIAVPIVTNRRFYGVLGASVQSGPERIEPTSSLLDRLAGVVAQASIALDNARMVEAISHQARHDNLTGLLGHRAFHEELERLARVHDGDGEFALALIDIDDFKLVNDLHGHPVGDRALRRVAEALSRATREQDTVFRVGGEEFAVVMPDTAPEDAVGVADRLRTTVAQTPFVVPLRVSLGVAGWPADAVDRDTLLARADAGLYAAKRAGKDRTTRARDENGGASGSEPGTLGLLELVRSKGHDGAERSAHVAALAVELGRALELAPDRLADLRGAARFHDIGKVAVPDAILHKPGPLTDEELALVRTHPQVGAELLRAWRLPAAAEIVLEHHERIDGSGYPHRLTGDEISLEARILHAVDAFSAMTSERPHRAALTIDAAVAELQACAGRQFDAPVVEALARLVRARDPIDEAVFLSPDGALR